MPTPRAPTHIRKRLACDRCHSHKLRCPKRDNSDCLRCAKAGAECVFSRSKRTFRAPAPGAESIDYIEPVVDSSSQLHDSSATSGGSSYGSTGGSTPPGYMDIHFNVKPPAALFSAFEFENLYDNETAEMFAGFEAENMAGAEFIDAGEFLGNASTTDGDDLLSGFATEGLDLSNYNFDDSFEPLPGLEREFTTLEQEFTSATPSSSELGSPSSSTTTEITTELPPNIAYLQTLGSASDDAMTMLPSQSSLQVMTSLHTLSQNITTHALTFPNLESWRNPDNPILFPLDKTLSLTTSLVRFLTPAPLLDTAGHHLVVGLHHRLVGVYELLFAHTRKCAITTTCAKIKVPEIKVGDHVLEDVEAAKVYIGALTRVVGSWVGAVETLSAGMGSLWDRVRTVGTTMIGFEEWTKTTGTEVARVNAQNEFRKFGEVTGEPVPLSEAGLDKRGDVAV